MIENPAIADWFFFYRVQKFIEVGVLGATDYWIGFEWQHRGSPHVHGLGLPNAPNVKELHAVFLQQLRYSTAFYCNACTLVYYIVH